MHHFLGIEFNFQAKKLKKDVKKFKKVLTVAGGPLYLSLQLN